MPSLDQIAPSDEHEAGFGPFPALVSRLTPAGSAAIATLGLAGPKAAEILTQVFQTSVPGGAGELLHRWRQHQRTDRICVGRLGDPDVGMDEVVLAVKQWQPVPAFEVHCHGGEQVVALLIESLAARGAKVVGWEEFSRFVGELPLKVLARKVLSRVSTMRAASIVLDQFHGAFARALKMIEHEARAGRLDAVRNRIEDLLRWSPVGRHLAQPWKVVVAGPPNVGKSSLINRLAGYQRCVVSHEPGTTRDLVAVRVAIDGWAIELIDSAGRRDSPDPIEHAGVQLAVSTAKDADFVLWVEDCREPHLFPESNRPVLRVRNKIDLGGELQGEGIYVSAKTGDGVDRLMQQIVSQLVPSVPPAGAAVPFTPWLCDKLEEMLAAVQMGAGDSVGKVLEEIERQPC